MTNKAGIVKVWLVAYQYSFKRGHGVGNILHRQQTESELISHEKLKEIEKWIAETNQLDKVVITGFFRLADESTSLLEGESNG